MTSLFSPPYHSSVTLTSLLFPEHFSSPQGHQTCSSSIWNAFPPDSYFLLSHSFWVFSQISHFYRGLLLPFYLKVNMLFPPGFIIFFHNTSYYDIHFIHLLLASHPSTFYVDSMKVGNSVNFV